MIKNKRKSNIFSKLFARKKTVTIDSILAQDDVTEAINILLERQHKIKSLMIIHVNKDDTFETISTDDIKRYHNSDWIWWAKQIKNDIFNGED
jgi:signal recognition particle receptor subunit beta